MKRVLVPNLIGAQVDAFLIAHKNGVFHKKDFIGFIKTKKHLMLNNVEIARLFNELITIGTIASKNQQTFVVTDNPVLNYNPIVRNIQSTFGIKPGTKIKPRAKKDYINVVTGYIISADSDKLDHLQDLINQRRNVIKEEERLRSTYNGLLEFANCDNAEELIELINKAKNL